MNKILKKVLFFFSKWIFQEQEGETNLSNGERTEEWQKWFAYSLISY